ncbi:hypothetical protein EB118_25810 [bacterium]|nr:hypothetical protein [bacterium]NDD83500.1 hypothetical protein [bacterium]NDG33458.1 hypothetical protein [bacterium]
MGLIDIQQVDFSKFKIGKSGKNYKLLYENEPAQFCTSTMYTPFGVNLNTKEWSSFTEYSIDCALNQSTSEASTQFKDFVENLDKTIQNLLTSENTTAEFVYYPMLWGTGNYPKRLKLQFPRDKNGNFMSFVFDTNKQKVMLSENNIETLLSKGKVFKCIIECSRLWIYNGKAGSIWNINQLKFSQDLSLINTPDSSGMDVYSQLMIE